jgi:uncharacterized protein YjdB
MRAAIVRRYGPPEVVEVGELPAPAPAAGQVRAVVISPAEDTLAVGQRAQLIATAHSSSGAEVPNRQFSWWSSHPAVASVGAAGLVTAHAVGVATIGANSGVPTGTARIVVVAAR